uniref:Ribosomal protein S3 n=2 Tax=Gracilaria tenuistipitata TaxID=2510778 RepID=A0A2S1PUQ8_GRATE|nr:ribosomal protein S3 [Gracilaria tenuistipitata]ARU07660.1 ribosomal protein S3 [Gracilaria tenuistipitata]AWH62563.1 ribosomal protein S3 [Gracilaria tenuistipitata]AWH62588.1 ribosomal protein S3 [Gracilaria tenuistipitata var. liui]
MTKKINPISLRLGLTQVWAITIQNYSKLNDSYVLSFFKHLQVDNIVTKILRSNRFLINDKEFWYFNNKLFLNIYYDEPIEYKLDNYLLLIRKLSKVISNWFSLKIYLRMYKKIDLVTTSNLISNYALYLFEQNKNPNKVLWQISQFLQRYLNYGKVVYSTKGIRSVYLKGFKIRLIGRFDNTKSQMAKSIQQSSGTLSLISLKNQVEFTQKNLYTKLGNCGLQIWLFYEIN